MHACMHACMYVCMHACMCVVSVCIHVRMCISVHVCRFASVAATCVERVILAGAEDDNNADTLNCGPSWSASLPQNASAADDSDSFVRRPSWSSQTMNDEPVLDVPAVKDAWRQSYSASQSPSCLGSAETPFGRATSGASAGEFKRVRSSQGADGDPPYMHHMSLRAMLRTASQETSVNEPLWNDWRTRRCLANVSIYITRQSKCPTSPASGRQDDEVSEGPAVGDGAAPLVGNSSEEALIQILDQRHQRRQMLKDSEALGRIVNPLITDTMTDTIMSAKAVQNSDAEKQSSWAHGLKMEASDLRRLWRATGMAVMAVARMKAIVRRRIVNTSHDPLTGADGQAESSQVEGFSPLVQHLSRTELGKVLVELENISLGKASTYDSESRPHSPADFVADHFTSECLREECGLNSGVFWVAPRGAKRQSLDTSGADTSIEQTMPSTPGPEDTMPGSPMAGTRGEKVTYSIDDIAHSMANGSELGNGQLLHPAKESSICLLQ